jgi:DNA oxidative demethylase
MQLFFDGLREALPRDVLGAGTAVLQGFAEERAVALISEIDALARTSPFRHMTTPGGFEMSVALTNCGVLGWASDRSGYRYTAIDPLTRKPWPSMPRIFLDLASEAADEAGYSAFVPDACLVNRYEPGTRLTLHQDKNEKDFDQPIVSVSLGLPATFLFGGMERSDKTIKVPVIHGDVLVWGGPARLKYHGILPLKDGEHALAGRYRYNLTLRRAG